MSEIVKDLPCFKIKPGKNDRTVFKLEDLVALAESIRDNGLVEPIIVRPIDSPDYESDRYEIVAGERRFRAVSQILGLHTILAIVRELTDEEASAAMLIENVHRVDLNPMDEARGYQKRMNDFGWTINKIYKETNVSVKRIESRLSLLNLVPEMQHLIETDTVGVQFGESMSELDANRQRIALQYVVKSERPLLRELRAIVGKLHAEQVQEPMFDLNALVSQAIEQETDDHNGKYVREYPIASDMPRFERIGSLGFSLEHYIATLVRTGNHHAAAIVGRIYQGMIESNFCFPPKENSPLAECMSEVKVPEDENSIFVESFTSERFNKMEL